MRFGLRWVDWAGVALGALLVGALDRFRNHYDWTRTASTMAIFAIFLVAVFFWTNRRRDLHNARVREESDDRDPGEDDQRGR